MRAVREEANLSLCAVLACAIAARLCVAADVPVDEVAAAHLHRGVELLGAAEAEQALAELQLAAIADPPIPQAGLWLARLYHWTGQNELAKAEYRKVADLPGDPPEACEAMMEYVRLPGQVDDRVAVCREIIRRWPRQTRLYQALAVQTAPAYAAVLLVNEGRFGEALDILEEATLDPRCEYSDYNRLELRRAVAETLEQSGRSASGVPPGHAQPLILTRAKPSYGKDYEKDDPDRDAFPHLFWAHSFYFQAEEGYWFKSLHLDAAAQTWQEERAHFYFYRTGFPWTADEPSGTMLYMVRNARGLGEQDVIVADCPLAPGTRSMRLAEGVWRDPGGLIHFWKVTAELEPLGQTGALKVESWPPGKVLIDGRPAGTTLDSYPCVPAGEHELDVEFQVNDSFPIEPDRLPQRVNVLAGQQTTVRFDPYVGWIEPMWDAPIDIRIPLHEYFSPTLFAARDGSVLVFADTYRTRKVFEGNTLVGTSFGHDMQYGRLEPGVTQLTLLPLALPTVANNAVCRVIAEEPDGSFLVLLWDQVTEQGKTPGRRRALMTRTRDFVSWSFPTPMPEPIGGSVLLAPRKDLYALFSLHEVRPAAEPGKLGINVRYSRDRGASWSEPVTIGVWEKKHHDEGQAPLSCTTDNKGRFWVAHQGSGVVRIWTSGDPETWQGQTWEGNVYVPDPGFGGGAPPASAWQLPNGRYALAYVDSRKMVVVTTSDDGQRWGKPKTLSNYAAFPRIAPAPDGSLWEAGHHWSRCWLRRCRLTE